MASGIERTPGDTPMPVGSRLPSLHSHVGGGELRWRDPAGGSTVAVFLQSADRDADRAYLRGLAEAADDFRLWNGRVIVVMPDQLQTETSGPSRAPGDRARAGPSSVGGSSAGASGEAANRGAGGVGAGQRRTISVVTEPEGEAEHCGVRGGEDAILIADRWGEVYYGARGDSPAALPDASEIREWLQFLATQCPECGVPDEP